MISIATSLIIPLLFILVIIITNYSLLIIRYKTRAVPGEALRNLARGGVDRVDHRLSCTGQRMSDNRLASRNIDLGTQILGRNPIHSMGSIVIEIEFQTSILSDYWLAIQVGVVGDSHQFLLLVGIVPQTAFDDLSADTWHVIFNGLARVGGGAAGIFVDIFDADSIYRAGADVSMSNNWVSVDRQNEKVIIHRLYNDDDGAFVISAGVGTASGSGTKRDSSPR